MLYIFYHYLHKAKITLPVSMKKQHRKNIFQNMHNIEHKVLDLA